MTHLNQEGGGVQTISLRYKISSMELFDVAKNCALIRMYLKKSDLVHLNINHT